MLGSPAPKTWAEDSPTCETHTLFGNTRPWDTYPSAWPPAKVQPRVHLHGPSNRPPPSSSTSLSPQPSISQTGAQSPESWALVSGEKVHSSQTGLGRKHFTSKQQVSFSWDFSEPLENQCGCASPRGRDGIQQLPSSLHKSLYCEASHGTHASQDIFWNWKMDSFNKYLLSTYHMPGADSKIIPPRMPTLFSNTLLLLITFFLAAPLVRETEGVPVPPSPEGN